MCAARFVGFAFSLLLICSRCSAQEARPPSTQAASQRQEALSLEQLGRYPDAEHAWRAILAVHPRSAEAYAHLGLLAARQEDYQKAIPLYRKALALGPDLPGLHFNLGLALFKSGHPKESIPEFSVLLHSPSPSQPDVLRAQLLIGMAHYAQGEYAEAVPFLKEAAVGDPGNLELRLVLAHSCLWSKQNQCVLDTYKEILAINPDSAEADMLAGETFDEMKNSDGATKMFRAAVKADPKQPGAHFGLGYLLWKQKQYPEAASEFQAELANDPNHAQAMLYLGDTLLQLNKPDEARVALENSVKLDPSFGLAHLDLGIIAADADKNDDALRELQAAAKLQPKDVNVHWRLGKLYRTLGRKEEAKAEFEKASSLTKAADEDLSNMLDNARKKREQSATAPAEVQQP